MSDTPEFRYKPEPLLQADERTFKRMRHLGVLRLSQIDCAGVLGCSVDTLRSFWAHHPEFREVYEQGAALDKLAIAQDLRNHAKTDPATARYLANNYLGLSNDPAKAALDKANTELAKGKMTKQELEGRILELTAKMGGADGDDREVDNGAQDQGRQSAEPPAGGPRRIGPGPAGQSAQGRQPRTAGPVDRHSPRGTGDPRGDEAQLAADAGSLPGPDQPSQLSEEAPRKTREQYVAEILGPRLGPIQQPAPPPRQPPQQPALSAIQKRLDELEATAVRRREAAQPKAQGPQKKPLPASQQVRKDGLAADAPPRLPGRIGPR